MSDDETANTQDLLDLGVRADPNLPPMTSAQDTSPPAEQVSSDEADEALPARPSVLPPVSGARLSGAQLGALVGEDAQEQAAERALERAERREDHSES